MFQTHISIISVLTSSQESRKECPIALRQSHYGIILRSFIGHSGLTKSGTQEKIIVCRTLIITTTVAQTLKLCVATFAKGCMTTSQQFAVSALSIMVLCRARAMSQSKEASTPSAACHPHLVHFSKGTIPSLRVRCIIRLANTSLFSQL